MFAVLLPLDVESSGIRIGAIEDIVIDVGAGDDHLSVQDYRYRSGAEMEVSEQRWPAD